MIREYRINAEDIPHYELEILKSGVCKALVPGSYYSENDTVVIVPDCSGFNPIEDRFSMAGEEVLDTFKLTLKMLRSVIEALRLCRYYLIRPEDISLSLDNLVFTQDMECGLLLMPGGDSETTTRRILALTEEVSLRFPRSNASAIKEKILEEDLKCGLNSEGLLRLLSRWEMELNN